MNRDMYRRGFTPPNKTAPETETQIRARWQTDPFASQAELAKEFHVSPSTVQRIIERMRYER